MLDYSGCVLYNWALLDEKGPVDMNNARMLRRFTGLVDEEWFFKTHLVIEAAAAPADSGRRRLAAARVWSFESAKALVLAALSAGVTRQRAGSHLAR